MPCQSSLPGIYCILMSATPELIFYITIGVLILVILFWILRTEQRLRRFFLGKKAKDLEDTIEILQKNITELQTAKDKTEKNVAVINQKLRKSIRGLEVKRFNPFPDQGGNQSFALSVLDENGDGVILSSLYSRERASIFAKPIKNGKTEYELTEEEREVLDKAKINDAK